MMTTGEPMATEGQTVTEGDRRTDHDRRIDSVKRTNDNGGRQLQKKLADNTKYNSQRDTQLLR